MTSGPAALVRSIPAALGRTPADELVLVGITHLAPSVAVILSVDLSGITGEAAAEETAVAVTDAVIAAARDGATKVAVVVYSDDGSSADSTPARFGAVAVVAAEAAGLGILDAISVANGRWRSYECDDPSCCPPEGTPITESPTP